MTRPTIPASALNAFIAALPARGRGHDDEWNTAPLCRDCRTIKGAVRSLRRHAEGLAAQTGETA